MKSSTFANPILAGFYPDPSICRAGDDYYLATSSFEYFPGVPIFHSRDLVHWRQIGHVLDRPAQLDLDNVPASCGIYAPTIRYHNGMFYMITTLRKSYDGDAGQPEDFNFIVTAHDPAGAWSEPYWLDDAPSIDPSLFFDDDGRVWYTGKRIPPGGESFEGHREIWLQELDIAQMQLIGPKYTLWDGALKGAIHVEGPHLYKINDMYYLLVAEAGTGHNHAVTIARSKAITGPYESNPRNPILTHRHLGNDYPIVNTGHADIVQTPHGEWWMVLLASRPYGGYFCNLGRETFLVPMIWEDDWPIVSPGTGRVEYHYPVPELTPTGWAGLPACDHFLSESLDFRWNFLRTPRERFWCTGATGGIRLTLRPATIMETGNPSFIGRRQQHKNFAARTSLSFRPQNMSECAGVVLLQNERFQFRLTYGLAEDGANVLTLIKRENGVDHVLTTVPISAKTLYFKIEAHGQAYNFYYATQAEQWQVVMEDVDGRILSTQVAGGYVGAYLGLYASSNGTISENSARFQYFEYHHQ